MRGKTPSRKGSEFRHPQRSPGGRLAATKESRTRKKGQTLRLKRAAWAMLHLPQRYSPPIQPFRSKHSSRLNRSIQPGTRNRTKH